jgi:hypothetical protein
MSTTQSLIAAIAGVALVSATGCQSDAKNINDRLDRIERKLDQALRAGGGARGAPVERDEPAPDATFAVDVKPDLQIGMVDGPASACVTIVEAWDFG